MGGAFLPISLPSSCFSAFAPNQHLWVFLSLCWGEGGGIQCSETHLRWELAALWVSRVCTRLLPRTEIAASGKAWGRGLGGRGVNIMFPQGR